MRKLLTPKTIAALGCASRPNERFSPSTALLPFSFSFCFVPSTYLYSGSSKSGDVPPDGCGCLIVLNDDLEID